MKSRIKYFLSIILFLFASCENREWNNPYDPDCPKELFTPSDFEAVQDEEEIKLTWSQSNSNISGFVIERSLDNTSWSNVATLTKTETSWNDSDIEGGTQYYYRIVAQAGGNPSNEETTQITPIFSSEIITNPVQELHPTSAVLGGEITSDGGGEVTARGVCWNTSANPTIENSKTEDGNGTGTFVSSLTGLTSNTTYYARAYSTNRAGTSYGNEITFKTYYGEVTDIDGNVYPTVKIGEQIWMAENLKVTKYNDGEVIPNLTNNTEWASTTAGTYRWYGNEYGVNQELWGAMYNWYAVGTGKMAPQGWRVATDEDWKELEMYLGMTQEQVDQTEWRGMPDQADELKSTSGWGDSNGTNNYGFSALPGGYAGADGSFGVGGLYAGWWTSTELSETTAIERQIGLENSGIARSENANKNTGLSVRCVLGDSPKFLATISLNEASGITTTNAFISFNITDDGGAAITERGICYSTSVNPTVNDTKVAEGSGDGYFGKTFTGFSSNTTYYVRAYAINSQGIAYSNEVSFKTYYGEVTDIDGNVYPTVKIGEQIWMAENLKTTKFTDGTPITNVTDANEWSSTTDAAYSAWNNNIDNLDIYGGLYNYYTIENTKIICPEGWHIPTIEEWQTLGNYLGGSGIAGYKMKSTSGWVYNGNGSNKSGFNAFPYGSRRNYDAKFVYSGSYANWWSSTEKDSTNAWAVDIWRSSNSLNEISPSKNTGFSIRCIMGDPPVKSLATISLDEVSGITTTNAFISFNITDDGGATITERGICYSTNSNPTTDDTKIAEGSGAGYFEKTFTGFSPNTTYYVRAYAINIAGTAYSNEVSFTTNDSTNNVTGTFTDSRDGNEYKWVKIGEQVWMAENLAYLPSVSPPDQGSTADPIYYVYGYSGTDITEAKASNNYQIYGVLYNWPAVMQGSEKSYLNPSGVQGICPAGWHVPSHLEWEELNTFLGKDAGGKMKSINGWEPPNSGATNSSGFNGLPGGSRYSGDNSFHDFGISGKWYSTNEQYTEGMSQEWNTSQSFTLSSYYSDFRMGGSTKLNEGRSVRCIKD